MLTHQTTIILGLLLLSCGVVHSQVAAAGWCVVTNGNGSSDNQPPDDPLLAPDPNDQSANDSSLGCDIGIAFSLYRYKRLALVAVVGSESLGPGIAWIINPYPKSETDHRPVLGIGIGIALPYDTDGIVLDPYLTLGMTLSLRQGIGANE